MKRSLELYINNLSKNVKIIHWIELYANLVLLVNLFSQGDLYDRTFANYDIFTSVVSYMC